MDWTPDEIRALAAAIETKLGRPVLEMTPRTTLLVIRALRHFAAVGFAVRNERIVIEVSDPATGTVGEVVAEVADFDAARLVFDAVCAKRPGDHITMRKRGWVIGLHRRGET